MPNTTAVPDLPALIARDRIESIAASCMGTATHSLFMSMLDDFIKNNPATQPAPSGDAVEVRNGVKIMDNEHAASMLEYEIREFRQGALIDNGPSKTMQAVADYLRTLATTSRAATVATEGKWVPTDNQNPLSFTVSETEVTRRPGECTVKAQIVYPDASQFAWMRQGNTVFLWTEPGLRHHIVGAPEWPGGKKVQFKGPPVDGVVYKYTAKDEEK